MTSKPLLLSVASVGMACLFLSSARVEQTSGPLPNDVYIWQRSWTDAVKESVADHGSSFSELAPLNAEVSWAKGELTLMRVSIDYATLRASGRPIALVLRAGGIAGRLQEGQISRLKELAASLLAEAASNQLSVAELQIDFDCAESKLDDYRRWISVVRRHIAPVPLTITALPSWLKRRAFKDLIAEADGYVLQVHSLQRPKALDAPFVLCDPKAARAAVERAARLGRPFRVALPTYGYLIAFDESGRFVGLAAEGPSMAWPDGVRLRELRADATALADLVQEWTRNRPKALRGLIWYRLPVPGESLNWAWPTLAAVMTGASPHPELKAELRRPRPGLVELDLLNSGTDDYRLPVQLSLQWRESRLVACDGLQGFELKDNGNGSVNFQSKSGLAPIAPGERRMVGWLRLTTEAEVKIEMQSN